MCILEATIFGTAGAILTSLSTIDSDACIDTTNAGIAGVIYTLFGIIFASIAG